MRLIYTKPILNDLSQGSRIAFIRQLRHMSQDEVSDKLGITGECKRRTMTRYEKGDRNPKKDRIKDLANILNVSVNSIKQYDYKKPTDLIYSLMWLEELIPNYFTIYTKEYFLQLLSKDVKDETILSRCQREIERGILFVIESLYNYKQHNKSVFYQFDSIRNSLLMYILKLVDCKSPHPLLIENDITVTFIDGCSLDYVDWVDKQNNDYRLINGSNEYEDFSKHYIFIPRCVVPNDMTFRINDFHQFQTIEDYHQFKDKYVIVHLDDTFLDDSILN